MLKVLTVKHHRVLVSKQQVDVICSAGTELHTTAPKRTKLITCCTCCLSWQGCRLTCCVYSMPARLCTLKVGANVISPSWKPGKARCALTSLANWSNSSSCPWAPAHKQSDNDHQAVSWCHIPDLVS